MPERKLVKHGPSTFMVSLPKRWVDANHFKKGDSIKYEEAPDSVTFYASESKPEKKTIEIDVTGLQRSYVMFMIRALYRQGFSEVTVRFKQPTITHYRTGEQKRIATVIQEEVQHLIGVEVASHSPSSIVLKQLAEPHIDDLRPNVRRIFFILSGAYAEMVDAIKDNRVGDLESVEEKHAAITKFVNYAIRVLNLTYHKEGASFLMHSIMMLEHITDILKTFARNSVDRKVKFPSGIEMPLKLLGEMHSLVDGLFFQWDVEKANRVDELREDITEAVWNIKETDMRSLMSLLLPAVEAYRDITVARLSMADEIL